MFINVGTSVTGFCSRFSQPRGGLLKLRDLKKIQYNDAEILFEKENIHPIIMGTVVDYLTRFMFNKNAKETFKLSLHSAKIIREGDTALKLISKVKGLDDESIDAACKLSSYDVIYRAGSKHYRDSNTPTPDCKTICNIRVMVNRAYNYLKDKEIIDSGVTFEGAYNNVISTGDGDFISKTSIIDLKVSKRAPNKDNILQVIIYQIMSNKSYKYRHLKINNIDIYNPRLNISYRYDLRNMKPEYYYFIHDTIYS